MSSGRTVSWTLAVAADQPAQALEVGLAPLGLGEQALHLSEQDVEQLAHDLLEADG